MEGNIEEKQIVETNKSGGNKGLIILLILIIIGLAGYIAYDKLVVDNNSKVETTETGNSNKKEISKEETISEKDKQSEEQTKSTLFNKEVIISNECPDYNCDKELGTFTIGNDTYTASLSLKPENESFVVFDNGKKIGTQDKYSDKFDKIVKIGDDYLAIGTKTGPNIGYSIKIYDSNLNRVKDYSSLKSVPMKDTFKDYFTVEGNTFTRYTCDASKDTGDGTNQYLVKHLVTINNGTFEEKEVSRVKEYCSAQS